MSEPNDTERQRFEEWAIASPYKLDVTRSGPESSQPGAYAFYGCHLAWAAWQEAVAGTVRIGEPLPMPVRNHGVEYLDETT